MTIHTEATSNSLLLVQTVVFECETLITYYGTIDDANKYFDGRLHSNSWDDATESDKRKALIMATRAIDRLNFVGSKYSATQTHEFLRDTETHVPAAIKVATYEEALSLLDGIEIEAEKRRLSAISQGFSSVRTTYDRTYVPDHINSGITSYTAWMHLVPYLRDPNEISLSRV